MEPPITVPEPENCLVSEVHTMSAPVSTRSVFVHVPFETMESRRAQAAHRGCTQSRAWRSRNSQLPRLHAAGLLRLSTAHMLCFKARTDRCPVLRAQHVDVETTNSIVACQYREQLRAGTPSEDEERTSFCCDLPRAAGSKPQPLCFAEPPGNSAHMMGNPCSSASRRRPGEKGRPDIG